MPSPWACNKLYTATGKTVQVKPRSSTGLTEATKSAAAVVNELRRVYVLGVSLSRLDHEGVQP